MCGFQTRVQKNKRPSLISELNRVIKLFKEFACRSWFDIRNRARSRHEWFTNNSGSYCFSNSYTFDRLCSETKNRNDEIQKDRALRPALFHRRVVIRGKSRVSRKKKERKARTSDARTLQGRQDGKCSDLLGAALSRSFFIVALVAMWGGRCVVIRTLSLFCVYI